MFKTAKLSALKSWDPEETVSLLQSKDTAEEAEESKPADSKSKIHF